MKKIPTLFPKDPNNLALVVDGTPVVDVFDNNLKVYLKLDGQSCCIIKGKLYTRYDAKLIKRKRGRVIKRKIEDVIRTLPDGAIPCQEPDPKSGHWPHWVPCKPNDKTHQYIFEGLEYSKKIFGSLEDGTYEIIGPKFVGNKHNLKHHVLFPHRNNFIDVTEDFQRIVSSSNTTLFEAVKHFVSSIAYEGIVFWIGNEPKAKIRRSDFDMSIDCYENPLLQPS